jgi:hypothetical protein
MEAFRALEEYLLFSNVFTTLAGDSTARSGKESSKVNASKVLGPQKTIKVSRDKIKAIALYKEGTSQSSNVQLLTYIASAGSRANSGGGERGNII